MTDLGDQLRVLAQCMEGLHMQQGSDARQLAISSCVQHAVGLHEQQRQRAGRMVRHV